MEEKTRSFSLLKPICDKVIRVPSKENCRELITVLQLKGVHSPEVLQELQPYILFPLELHLKSSATREDTRLLVVECINELLKVTSVTSIPKLFSLLSLIFFQICDKNSACTVANVSEELKMAVTQCASTLVRRASSAVKNDMYSKTNVPKVSQGISITIRLVQTERSRAVRISAIEYISTFAQVHDAAFPSDKVLRHKIADFLMFVLPGIIGGLSKLLTSDEKQGHKVTVAAIRAWSRIVCIVLEDTDSAVDNPPFSINSIYVKSDQQDTNDPNLFSKICQNQDREGMIDYLATQSRTPEWIETTAGKLSILMEKVALLQSNQHWVVRYELGLACSLLLTKCSHNLKPCAMQLLEILIMLSEDEVEKVATVSKEALKEFSTKCESEKSKSLLEILEENFFSLVTKIPRILHSTNDAEQLSSLRLLAGYIRMLGPTKLPEVLNSANHLRHLATTLIYIVELDNVGVSLLEDISLRTLNSSQNTGLAGPWKQFRNFTDRTLLSKTEEICKLVGHLGEIAIITDHFIDLYYSDPLHRKEIILLLSELTCSKQDMTDYHLHIIKNVIDTYMEPSMWYVPLTAGDEHGLSVGEAHNNLVLSCLLVEGVGKIALSLGKHFDRFLLRTLYMVLERAGSSHGLLATAGMEAAERLAVAGGHSSVTQLVCANVDYFSHHVTIKLRRYEQNVGVLDVLNVVMKHSSIDVLPCLRDIVGDILLQSCDTYQGSSAIAFLRVFHTFVLCIRRWFAEGSSEKFAKRGPPTKAQCRDFDKELNETIEAQKRFDQLLETGEENTDHIEDMPMPEEEAVETEMDDSMYIDEHGMKKKKVPGYIKMTVSVLTRCVHFLPSSNVTQKLIVLETLREGIKVLADWEDELLPVVHLIWSPLIGRFRENPLIMKNSFNLLCTMGIAAKDFIRSRTLHDVLPSIYQYLEKSAVKSFRKDSGSVYRFSQDYKLQYDLLDGLGLLAVDLSFSANDVEDMMTATIQYLNHFQPEPLQNCCVTLFKHLSTQDRSSVWAKANSIIQPGIANRNSEQLHKNAKLILEFCNKEEVFD